MSGRVRLLGCRFHGRHGVHPEEAVLGAHYEADVELELDLADAGRTDDLAHTADYGAVFDALNQTISAERYALLEAIAHVAATRILAAAPRAEAVTVTVRKLHPPVAGLCRAAEVSLRVAR